VYNNSKNASTWNGKNTILITHCNKNTILLRVFHIHRIKPFKAYCCHMGTAIKHPVPDRGKPGTAGTAL